MNKYISVKPTKKGFIVQVCGIQRGVELKGEKAKELANNTALSIATSEDITQVYLA